MRKKKYEIIWDYTKAIILPLGIPVSYSEITLKNIAGHRVNLCVYFNARISENYDFDKNFYFYVTEEDVGSNLFLSLGNCDSVKSKILEQFSDKASVKKSKYFYYFARMKRNIIKEIINEKIFEKKSSNHFVKNKRFFDYCLPNNKETIFLGYCNKTKEFVRLIVNADKNIYLLKTSKSYLGNIDYYIPDFDELDERLLHLQTVHNEIDILNIKEDSPYFEVVDRAKHQMAWPDISISNVINPDEIHFMEFIEKTYFMWNEPPTCIRKILFTNKGEITKVKKTKKEEKQISSYVPQNEIHDLFDYISHFLTDSNLSIERFIDDSEGSLFIHYKDEHIEEYDRGLTRNGISLLDIIRQYIHDDKFFN